jgi:hypothetical protein
VEQGGLVCRVPPTPNPFTTTSQALPQPSPSPPQSCPGPAQRSPSLSMPTRRHLVKRQAWQALRLRLVISHSLEAGQLYSMLPARKRQGSSGSLLGPRRGPSDRRALTRPGQAMVWG